MFKSYFKTALRFLLKNKAFGLINIFGLAAGTLCCLYIVLYVDEQYSYDKHHEGAKNIYRVITEIHRKGDTHTMATCSPPIAPAMKKDFPEIVQFTRVIPTLDAAIHLLQYGDKSFYEREAVLVDSTFFDVFSYHFNSGSPATAMNGTNVIILLKPIADKLFGKEDPIGKRMTITDSWGKNDFTVSAVVDESLGKSHLQANMFIKMNPHGFGSDFLANDTWSGNNFTNSYVKLRSGADAAQLETKLPAFLLKYGGQQMKDHGMQKILHLQSVGAIHTSAGLGAEPAKIVSSTFLYILLLIAALIQIIACINFMNLSTARASKRAKEVGVRKVIGAGRGDLIRQFLGESFLLSLVAIAIALPLLAMVLPWLNRITEADIRLRFFADYRLWLFLAGLVLVTGLLAGSYPAVYLSAFRAVKVLKGNFTNHISASGIRRSLVVFQFVLSIVLITGIIIIYSQLNYIKNKDLGFDPNQKLVFNFYTDASRVKMPLFASELAQLAEVKATTRTNNYPGRASYHDWDVFLQGGSVASGVDQQNLSSDENFAKATGVQLLSGRDFILHDSAKVLINETLLHRLGLKSADAPGTKLYSGDDRVYEIAGVIKDFNYKSLHDQVKPFMIICEPNRTDLHSLIVNTTSKDYKSLLGKMEQVWHKVLPTEPFEFTFLDEDMLKQYHTEITLSNIINSFTLMAILISCLGLFGLASFSAEQRSKEIGIRKVLGAGVPGLVQLLSKDFLKLVVIAIIIALPIGWWAMNKWLQGFAYRVQISWWMLALAAILAIFIAIATVSFQAIRAAIANPVKNLRSE